jgi:hypothetical protein
MNIIEELITALRNKDAGKARSLQPEIGPSELGSCARKVYYRLNSQPVTNHDDLKLSAIMGTAIHTEIEQALTLADPTGEKFMLETEVAYNGMKAHVDCYIPSIKTIVDWKTVKARTLSYFPSQQQRWQVQTYGYLMTHGQKMPVEHVALVAISRDGDERDVIMHKEPYDEAIALEALQWLADIKVLTEPPAPEKDAVSYCSNFCKYYDATGEVGCVGLKKENAPTVLIKELTVAQQSEKYLQVDNEIKILTKEKESLKSHLEGYTGVTEKGIQITWTPVAGRRTVDSEEVEKLLGFIPYKVGKESMRLEVKSINESGGNTDGSE